MKRPLLTDPYLPNKRMRPQPGGDMQLPPRSGFSKSVYTNSYRGGPSNDDFNRPQNGGFNRQHQPIFSRSAQDRRGQFGAPTYTTTFPSRRTTSRGWDG